MHTLTDAFEQAKRALSAFPYGFPIHHDVSSKAGREIRHIRVKNYLLYYFVSEGTKTVQAVSFLHETQDTRTVAAIDFDLID